MSFFSILNQQAPSGPPPPPPELTIEGFARTASNATNWEHAVSVPSGLVSGETLLAVTLGNGNQPVAPEDTTGWTIVDEAISAPTICVYRRTVTGFEPESYLFRRRQPNFGGPVNSNISLRATMMRISGLGSVSFTANSVLTSVNEATTPVTTATAGDLLMHIWGVASGYGLVVEFKGTTPPPAVDLFPPVGGVQVAFDAIATVPIDTSGPTAGLTRPFAGFDDSVRPANARGAVLRLTPG